MKKVKVIATFSKIFEMEEDDIPQTAEEEYDYIDCDPFAFIDDEDCKLDNVIFIEINNEKT